MLFNTMPTITNTMGMATINIGCITLSLIRLLIAFGFWKGEDPGPKMHVAVKPTPNLMPPLRCGPTFYLLHAIRTKEEFTMTIYRSESALARESVVGKLQSERELPCFENSRNVKMTTPTSLRCRFGTSSWIWISRNPASIWLRLLLGKSLARHQAAMDYRRYSKPCPISPAPRMRPFLS